MKKKSYLTAILLSLAFGVMGLFYTSAKAAIGMIVLIVVLTTGIIVTASDVNDGVILSALAAIVVLQIVSLALNLALVSRHNKKQATAESQNGEKEADVTDVPARRD